MRRHSSLARYQEKRDFSKTPEPRGMPYKRTGFRYLIQKHAASRLHYDFRLELDGVLKSWAVTRGPSLDPHVKRLAVEVEDHPIAYGSFEGIIPKGQYGGGTVMLWDEGRWEPRGDPHEGLKNGKLEFRLHGKRLKGEWVLVRMRPLGEDKGRNNWLLIKHADGEARVGDADHLLEKHTTSVATGRSMEKIAQASDRVWQSKKRIVSAMPGFIPPQLATLADAIPQGREWVHEIKFDGYRALACLEDGKARIFTRNRNDWTHKFRPIADALAHMPAQTAVIDGEIVVLEKNASSFKALQETLSEGKYGQLQYYVFDLLYLNGEDLTTLPLVERKARLKALLKKKTLKGQIFFSEHFSGRQNFLQELCRLRMEGAVSKRADAPYVSGRGKLWLKTKCHMRQEFVIGGFTLPAHAERGIGALLLGYYEGKSLRYAGRVGTGFDNDTSLALRKKLDALKQKENPFANVTTEGRRGACWVNPALVCEVEFTEWTPDNHLRHPSFQGLRADKLASTIKRDVPMHIRKTLPAKNANLVGGIAITHPDRCIYPGTDITKKQLAEYYLAVANEMMPYIRYRPLSMVRCPEGTGEPCFFQRHIARGQSPYLHETGIKVKGRDEHYLMIKDTKGLITLVQWGVIELHPWGCRDDKPDKPDRIIFDLDPDPALPFSYVIEGAWEIRTRMHEFGLESFVKTTGGKGLHVVTPIQRDYRWAPVKAFARAIADSMVYDQPKRYIAKANKAARKGKIFVDYLRNDLTSTAIAPYSARAREGAPVAMPIAWNVLTTSFKPARFTIENVPDYLRLRNHDPWQELSHLKQKLSAQYLRALKIDPER